MFRSCVASTLVEKWAYPCQFSLLARNSKSTESNICTKSEDPVQIDFFWLEDHFSSETPPSVMLTGRSFTTQPTNKLSKEDKDARKPIVMNVANELFSLMQGSRKQCYRVIGQQVESGTA
jgi:hypothetical protein